MFRPRLSFHKRPSALSGKQVISIYGEDQPFPVFSIDEWWSDAWDELGFGRDLDFSRPFFKQFQALANIVPRMANFNKSCENCDYCSYAGNSKNAYYSEWALRSQNVFYSVSMSEGCDTVCDCLCCHRCSYLYESLHCIGAHYSAFLLWCNDVRDCHFCVDCRSCSDCLFCSNLRNKQYHVRNKAVSREDYLGIKKTFVDGRFSTFDQNRQKWRDVLDTAAYPAVYQANCDDCDGDVLFNCSRCYECYNCRNTVDCRYCWRVTPGQKLVSSMDLTGSGYGELFYNLVGAGGGSYYLRMCTDCHESSELTYCMNCYYCRHCFGCCSLKRKQYCVFNKQLTKNEYESLIPRILEYMEQTGEWGKFFPAGMTPFPYNKSLASVHLPLPREEVAQRGWRWVEDKDTVEDTGPDAEMIDSVNEVSDAVCDQILRCAVTHRPYKIIAPELALYRTLQVPLPREHPDQRIARRYALLNPHRMWTRRCAGDGKEIRTTFSPDRPERVYCLDCYLQELR